MDRLQEILQEQFPNSQCTERSSDEWVKWEVDSFNNRTKGKLKEYDCPKCKNKGEIAFIQNGLFTTAECDCMKVRKTLENIEKSGLKERMSECTFKRFETIYPWQKVAKEKALRFYEDHENKWFFAGGQNGCGKTHLCSALVGKFIRAGKPAHYMLWLDEVVRLKASIMDDETYEKRIRPLKEIEVLYIDDFLKTEKDKVPTTAEIKIAFEILNYRYINRNLITIISSEMLLDKIVDIDEAVGSRIYERAKDYCFSVEYDRRKNYRLHGGGAHG